MSLHALPSAVSGFDETTADLLNQVPGNYQYLRDDAGLIETYAYDAPTGWLSLMSVQQGELGTPVKVQQIDYCQCGSDCACASSSSSSSSSSSPAGLVIYYPRQNTAYPSETDPTLTEVTSYCYLLHSGTCSIKQKMTTFPWQGNCTFSL